jgi:hypothetical protein
MLYSKIPKKTESMDELSRLSIANSLPRFLNKVGGKVLQIELF